MSFISSTQGNAAKNLHILATEAYENTISDDCRLAKLDDLGLMIEMLYNFVYGYTSISDDTFDTDDEILNWTFVDVVDDLNAANWNIACGFYKSAASSLRNSFEMAVVALYFQLRQNEGDKNAYNEYFAKWDRGEDATPNWGKTIPLILRQLTVQQFNQQYSCNVVEEVYSHFKYLCNFTHGRPFSPEDGLATNSINLSVNAPGLDSKEFERFMELAVTTVHWIATIWLITFPQILKTDPLTSNYSIKPYEKFFNCHRGVDALLFARTFS